MGRTADVCEQHPGAARFIPYAMGRMAFVLYRQWNGGLNHLPKTMQDSKRVGNSEQGSSCTLLRPTLPCVNNSHLTQIVLCQVSYLSMLSRAWVTHNCNNLLIELDSTEGKKGLKALPSMPAVTSWLNSSGTFPPSLRNLLDIFYHSHFYD